MSVCNCKVAFIRPTYTTLKEWMEDKNNFYVGRPGVVFVENDGKKMRWPPTNSNDTFGFIFANSHKPADKSFGELKKAVAAFENDLNNMLKDPEVMQKFKTLKGKNLGCWCVNHKHDKVYDYKTMTEEEYKLHGMCHADVILKKLSELENS